MKLVLLALLLCLAPAASAGLKYLRANDLQTLIRRDLLPLDTDSIRDLSNQLAVIADGPFPKSASQVRHRAQTITLSLRLLPSQKRAKEIQDSFLQGKDRPVPEEAEVLKNKNAILKTADWLTLLPKKSEGHLLGQLLLDIMQPVVIDHPLLARRSAETAPDRWNRVIARVPEFEFEDKPSSPTPPKPEPAAGREYATTGLLTEVPIITSNEEGSSPPVPGLVATSLVLTKTPAVRTPEGEETGERPPGSMIFQPKADFDIAPLHAALRDFFETHLEPLPLHYNMNVYFGSFEAKRTYLALNRENIAASLAMMLDAAVTGRPLRRDVIFFARLRASGKLEKPTRAWEILHRLEQLEFKGKMRLIVGSGMLEEMNALLVLNKASFFTRFEVFEAPTFEDARALYFEDGKMPEGLRAASVGYVEVREKADQANNLGAFLGLPSVEKRLVQTSRFSPHHLSARMLATQTVRRPAYFTRQMAAEDLDRRLEKVSQFRYIIDKTTESQVKAAYKAAREEVDPIERYLGLSEKALLSEAVTILKKLNSAGRNATSDPEFRQNGWLRDVDAFQKRLGEFRAKLRQIYDPVPVENE
jgi:hypothetical protein